MSEKPLIEELASRLSGKVMISYELTDDDIRDIDIVELTANILSFFRDKEGLKILDKVSLEKVVKTAITEKMPLQIEISKPLDFKPAAKDIEPEFRVENVDVEKTNATVNDFTSYFNDRFRRLRGLIENNGGAGSGIITNIDRIKQYTEGREIGIVGMVYDKITTKKGNIMINLEDETGSAKVIFLKADKESRLEARELFSSAIRIVSDEVIAVRGKISGPFIIAKSIIWPNIPIRHRKKTEEDIGIAFTSDIHVGSKLFLERQFSRFVSWINGNVETRKEIAEKIKYIVISGDLVDGIGVYPEQEKELSVSDIYKQYSMLFEFLKDIPEYIHAFVLTGNHDAVQRAEPQPPLTEELIKDFRQSNIHFVSNPGSIILHGIRILAYHGTSLDSIIQSTPGCSYAKPEIAMIEILKKRHISPIYGYNPITPSKKDSLVIEKVPDILHMGHLHRNSYTDYHGTQIINSGTWQGRTLYQVKGGHLPTPAMLPVYETRTGNVNQIDFNEA